MTPSHRRNESWMGRSLQYYKPRVTLHSVINRLFAKPRRVPARVSAVPAEEFSDVSFYQGFISWPIMRTKSRKVIIRAGQNIWVDIRFITNYLRAKQVGMLRGIYWFFDGRASPGAQAALLVSIIQRDPPELGIWIDWERNYSGAHEGIRNVVAMMQEVERLLPGVEVGLYTGFYFFIENSNRIAHASQYDYLAKKKLWLAFYTALLSDVRIPSLWPDMTYWQFGTPSSGEAWGVETKEIDMNMDMSGDPDPTPIPQPDPPTEEPMPTKYIGLVKSTAPAVINIRSTPNGADIGDIERGTAFEGTGELVSAGGFTWMQWVRPVAGWVATVNLDYQVVTPTPDPVPGLPVLNVTVSGPGYQTVVIELRPE